MSYARTTISASAKLSSPTKTVSSSAKQIVVPAVKTRTSTLPAIVTRAPRTIRTRATKDKEVSPAATDIATDLACRLAAMRAARATRAAAIASAPKKMRVVTPNEIRNTSVPEHRSKVPVKSLLRVREQAYAQSDEMRVRWLNVSADAKLALFSDMNAQYGKEAITALGPINEQRKCMGLPAIPRPVEPETRTHKARFAVEEKLFKVHPIVSRLIGAYKVTDADLTQSEIDNRIAAAKLKAEEDAMVIEAAKIQAEAYAERMAYLEARAAERAERLASVPTFSYTAASPIKAAKLTSSGAPGLLTVPVMNRYGRLDRDDDFEDEDYEEEQY